MVKEGTGANAHGRPQRQEENMCGWFKAAVFIGGHTSALGNDCSASEHVYAHTVCIFEGQNDRMEVIKHSCLQNLHRCPRKSMCYIYNVIG